MQQWRQYYDFTGTLHSFSLFHETIWAKKHDTNLASFKVHAHALDPRGEPIIELRMDWP